VAPDKLWVGTETLIDEIDRQLFSVATKITIGDGHKASFWQLGSPKYIAAKKFTVSKRKNRSVHDTLDGLKCISDIAINNFTADHVEQFIHMWDISLGFTPPGIQDLLGG
jgi:hypothetical protein